MFRNNAYTYNSNGSATLHVSHLPPNPAILTPGPALIFVVVNGIPSIGQWVMVGTGTLGKQPTAPAQTLPTSTGGDGGKNWNAGNVAINTAARAAKTAASTSSGAATPSGTSKGNGVEKLAVGGGMVGMILGAVGLLLV